MFLIINDNFFMMGDYFTQVLGHGVIVDKKDFVIRISIFKERNFIWLNR